MSTTHTASRTERLCHVTTDVRVSSARAEALAARLERGAVALAALARDLFEREWRTSLPGDGRAVGVVVHHVASVYPLEIELARRVASGAAIDGVTMADVDAMNARHAREYVEVTPGAAIALLETNSRAAAEAIRAFSDQELDRAAPASLYDGAPVSSQFVLEDHAVRHSYHHLSAIARALGRRVPVLAALVAAIGFSAATASAQSTSSLVDSVRAATRSLRTPAAAMKAGWSPATGCVSGPQSGAMGVHYINEALLLDGDLDAERPEALIFETRDGRTRLVGVEFLVLADQWHARQGAAPPVLHGQHFHYVGSPNRYGLAAFYELHVWAWRQNPNGTFADWRAHVTCDEGH
jgi:hypothetical protein